MLWLRTTILAPVSNICELVFPHKLGETHSITCCASTDVLPISSAFQPAIVCNCHGLPIASTQGVVHIHVRQSYPVAQNCVWQVSALVVRRHSDCEHMPSDACGGAHGRLQHQQPLCPAEWGACAAPGAAVLDQFCAAGHTRPAAARLQAIKGGRGWPLLTARGSVAIHRRQLNAFVQVDDLSETNMFGCCHVLTPQRDPLLSLEEAPASSQSCMDALCHVSFLCCPQLHPHKPSGLQQMSPGDPEQRRACRCCMKGARRCWPAQGWTLTPAKLRPSTCCMRCCLPQAQRPCWPEGAENAFKVLACSSAVPCRILGAPHTVVGPCRLATREQLLPTTAGVSEAAACDPAVLSGVTDALDAISCPVFSPFDHSNGAVQLLQVCLL